MLNNLFKFISKISHCRRCEEREKQERLEIKMIRHLHFEVAELIKSCNRKRAILDEILRDQHSDITKSLTQKIKVDQHKDIEQLSRINSFIKL